MRPNKPNKPRSRPELLSLILLAIALFALALTKTRQVAAWPFFFLADVSDGILGAHGRLSADDGPGLGLVVEEVFPEDEGKDSLKRPAAFLGSSLDILVESSPNGQLLRGQVSKQRRKKVFASCIYGLDSPDLALPRYARLWLNSCHLNRAFISCLIVVVLLDARDNRTEPSQVLSCAFINDEERGRFAHYIRVVSADSIALDLKGLGDLAPPTIAHKMLDYKPLIGALLDHWGYLASSKEVEFTHWAWVDLDGVIGQKLSVISENADLANYTTITFYGKGMWVEPTLAGQITAFRNDDEGINFWKRIPELRGILAQKHGTVFDEIGMPHYLTKRYPGWRRIGLHSWQASDHFAAGGGRAETFAFLPDGRIRSPLTGDEFVYFHFGWLKKPAFVNFNTPAMCLLDLASLSAYSIVVDGETNSKMVIGPVTT